ncbi:MAG TPA: glycosyltransferase family 4 protein [Myxococcaceae bacterium]|nr:glycosyltransferase family 4 protein [Myxococcaceae bacterium]
MLIVHPHFHRRRSGTTQHVEGVVTALTAAGEDARGMGSLLRAGVPGIPWRELLRRLGGEPAVWHAHRNNEMIVGLLLRALYPRLKLVFTRHSSQPPSWPTRFLAGRADARVTLTRQVADAFGLRGAIVGHGVDPDRFPPPPDRAAAWRALGLPGARGVGVVGRLRPLKGQQDFASAVLPVLEERPDWTAVLVGQAKWPEWWWARRLARLRPSRLLLAGGQRDVAPWYRAFTVLVQPSYEEAFSMVPLEAMASGCCVIASALPYAREVIDHGRTGFLYEPGDVGALRGLLSELMAAPERAEQIGRAASEEVRARFSVEREAARLADTYREVLAAG